ncbi:uncharacterized protein LOC118751043 [Rhagoletis pomonella]|uniref:uncharacterized protein LOC118751043 n=1 Tax=Rhagoletis pomonella TaxID=28610 RepID=UPI0017813B59|nr:uncharacterized protein LOC118751043 [Rhagoletis pomonella]
MGIGMLDSEESSSSAASSIALVLSASADENSNGVTPNLDAPKMCHNRIASYRHLDSTLDSTLSSENNTIIGSPNISHIGPECSNANHQHCNNNNKNTLDSFGDESKQTLLLQQCQSKNVDKVLPQYRKVAILGVGAGSSSSSASALQPNVTNSNSNSPSAGRSTRSPLATVSGNNHNRTVRNASQHESIGGSSHIRLQEYVQESESCGPMSRIQTRPYCILFVKVDPLLNAFHFEKIVSKRS